MSKRPKDQHEANLMAGQIAITALFQIDRSSMVEARKIARKAIADINDLGIAQDELDRLIKILER